MTTKWQQTDRRITSSSSHSPTGPLRRSVTFSGHFRLHISAYITWRAAKVRSSKQRLLNTSTQSNFKTYVGLFTGVEAFFWVWLAQADLVQCVFRVLGGLEF